MSCRPTNPASSLTIGNLIKKIPQMKAIYAQRKYFKFLEMKFQEFPCGTVEMNQTNNNEVAGLISGFGQW